MRPADAVVLLCKLETAMPSARAPKNEPATLGIAEAATPVVRPLDPPNFREDLHLWYSRHARKLPWRGIRNPYATWLSEIMLQQTRVAAVIDRYNAFLERFPSLQALAMAKEDEVLALWSGLGYYRRARMLHRAAQFVTRELGGKLPHSAQELRSLPGVGDYTAAAIASIAFGESIAVVDGNVERVLLRILGGPETGTAEQRGMLKRTAQSLVPEAAKSRVRANPPGTHNQAMMELGATICLPRQPLCLQCPVLDFCRTRGEHATPKRAPQKSRVVAHLLTLRKAAGTTEVLLEQRAAEASLMPGMYELPPLPLDAVEEREPVLRVRHAITNTNFYVEVYTPAHITLRSSAARSHLQSSGDAEDFTIENDAAAQDCVLLQAVPASTDDLHWTAISSLADIPLTGLARKVLQRLRVMHVGPPDLG